jgi:hypothetical protein
MLKAIGKIATIAAMRIVRTRAACAPARADAHRSCKTSMVGLAFTSG